MTVQKFQQTLAQKSPPTELSFHLQSLWYDAIGNWEKAHELIQDETDAFSAHLHAYLHRKEGDRGNAAYWYRRSGVPFPNLTLEQEWYQLVEIALQKG